MYQALYRKWRPKTFDDVVGQEHITDTLKSEMQSGRVSHAYLFTGTRGTGKTTCAKILAKAVNCLNPQNGNPCCECEICRGIDSEMITDVVEMDAASNRKIDDIREIIEKVQFNPTQSRYRVYIIDETHMLSADAFNALLKTLEEPPAHVVFILATTEVHKVLPTIRSRCQQFDFHRIAPERIAERLSYVAQQEELELTESAASLIASVSDGAMRDALSLLDRCISISGSIDEEVVRSAAGLADKGYLYRLAACVINKNTSAALNIIDRLYGEAKDMPGLCDELIAHFRGLMMIKTLGEKARSIVVFTDSEFEEALAQADNLYLAEIVYFMDVLSRAYQRMGRGVGDRTELEMALVKLTSPELDATDEALTARISALEKAVKRGIAIASTANNVQAANVQPSAQNTEESAEAPESAKTEAEDDKPAETKAQPKEEAKQAAKPEQKKPVTEVKPVAAPAQSEIDVVALSREAKPFPNWVEIVDCMKGISRSLFEAFVGSTAYENGGFLLIESNNEIAFDLLRKGENRRDVRNVLLEQTGKSYRLGPYKLKDDKKEKADPLEDFKNKLRDSGVDVDEE